MTTTPSEFMEELKDLCDEAAAEAMEDAKAKTKKELVDQIGTMASLIVSLQAIDHMQEKIIEHSDYSPYKWALGGAFVTFMAALFVAL